MKQIDISSPKYPNTFALVNDFNYEGFNQHKWYAIETADRKLYAVRNIRVNGKRKLLYMHVAVMGSIAGMEIDHRNGNGLDNQRHNLRHCTKSENQMNRGATINSTSGYKGVFWNKQTKAWRVQIRHNCESVSLGYFFCLIKAAKCYDKAAIKYHGKFANLNFKE